MSKKQVLENLKKYLENPQTKEGINIQGIGKILESIVPAEALVEINRNSGGDSVVLYIICSLLLLEES